MMRARGHDARLGEIAAYGLGDLSFNLVWTMMLTYLTYFYTETSGIRPEIAGLIVLGARVTNMVLDPVIGAIVDRRGEGRKARPLLMWSAVPLGVLMWLTFTTVSPDPGMRVIWAAVTYVVLCVAYSIANTPYGAMTTLISGNELVRGRLAVSRMAGATIGMLFVGMATLPLVDLFGAGDRVVGFSRLAALYGALVAAGLLLTGALCRERTGGEPVRARVGEIVRLLAVNRAWLAVTLSMSFYLIGQTFLFGMAPYYVLHVLGRPDTEAGFLLTVLNLFFLGGSFLALPLARRIGSRSTLLLGALGGAMLLLPLDAVPAGMATAMWAVGAAGLLLGIAAPMLYVLLADSADQGHAGSRVIAGACYAANSAICKISFGIGGYFMALLLSANRQDPGWTAQRGLVDVSAILFALSGVAILLYPRVSGQSRQPLAGPV